MKGFKEIYPWRGKFSRSVSVRGDNEVVSYFGVFSYQTPSQNPLDLRRNKNLRYLVLVKS